MTRSAAARCLAAAALLGLAGCINSPAAKDWFGELGASLDEGAFGDPTANNRCTRAVEDDNECDRNTWLFRGSVQQDGKNKS